MTVFVLFACKTFDDLECAFLNVRPLGLLAAEKKCHDGSFQHRLVMLLGAFSENQLGNIGTRHPI